MVRYHNFDIVFAEVPGEVTLAINLTRCPNRCPGCHSPHLQLDAGPALDTAELQALLDRYGSAITCVAFLGGDAEPLEVAALAAFVRQAHPRLRTAWYSGRERLPEALDPTVFDYLKLGPWIESRGPLSAPGTNQRFYRVGPDGALQDLTHRFRRR